MQRLDGAAGAPAGPVQGDAQFLPQASVGIAEAVSDEAVGTGRSA